MLPGKLPGKYCDMVRHALDQSELSNSSWLHEWEPHIEYPAKGFDQVGQGFILSLLPLLLVASWR